MSAIQVYCACGYTVRFAGEVPGTYGKSVLPCPMCSRDILVSQEVIRTHPVLRRLFDSGGEWNEADESQQKAALNVLN